MSVPEERGEEMTANVLLVNLPLADLSTTPFFVMPPGLLSVAAYLREKGETVACVDLNVFNKERGTPGSRRRRSRICCRTRSRCWSG